MTKRQAVAEAEGGTTKRTKAPSTQKLPNNILREIYDRVNAVTQARLRLATKAVYKLPPPSPVPYVRKRLKQLQKKLASIVQRLGRAQRLHYKFRVHVVQLDWIVYAERKVNELLRTYPQKPAEAERQVYGSTAEYNTRTDAQRVKDMTPDILAMVRATNQRLRAEADLIKRLLSTGPKSHLAHTHKNVNALFSRNSQTARARSKRGRASSWKYAPVMQAVMRGNAPINLSMNELLQAHRTARRDARIQRRAQLRQERG